MSEINKDNTEDKILEAAKTVFIQKGMDGARMQEIANEAGINKALLHYYFRTKQKLFEAIFSKVFNQIFPDIRSLIFSDKPFEERLSAFVERYIDLLLKNPFLPAFILKEINRDPDFLASIIKKQGINPEEMLQMIEREMEAGTICRMDPRDLMVNILGLSIFPFAARPLMQIMFFNNSKKEYKEFLVKRKETVKIFILDSILVNKKQMPGV